MPEDQRGWDASLQLLGGRRVEGCGGGVVVCFFFFFFLKGGDFLSFLRKKKEDLKTKQLVKFALDAAGGMAYLELKNCIHR